MNALSPVQLTIGVFIGLFIMVYMVKGHIAKKKVRLALSNGALVIDVRTPSEYSSGHYDGSVNIPVDKMESNLKKIGTKERTIVVYCASGSRSAAATRFLNTKGYKNVVNGGSLSSLP